MNTRICLAISFVTVSCALFAAHTAAPQSASASPASAATGKSPTPTKSPTQTKPTTPALPDDLSATDLVRPGVPSPAGAKFVEGWSHVRVKNMLLADRNFKAGLKLDKTSASCLFGMAYLNLFHGQWDDALKCSKAALKKDPKYLSALRAKGLAHIELDEYDDAVKEFSKAIALKPDVVEYYCWRGYAHLYNGHLSQARADLVKAHALKPHDTMTLFFKAHIEYYDCLYEWTVYNCDLVANTQTKMAGNFVLRAKAHMRLKKFYEAKSDVKLAESCGVYEHSDLLGEIADFEYDHVNAIKDPAKRFALALSSPMFELNREGFESLSGVMLTRKNIDSKRKGLKEAWGVYGHDDLIAMVKRQTTDGHNSSWLELWHQYKDSPDVLAKAAKSSSKLAMVHKYGKQFGERGILAWDLSRNISLCRWGFRAGYLTRDEAFALMMPQAEKIQKAYKSWDQFITEYYIGRRFWSESEYQEDRVRMETAQHRLLSDPNGLKKIPWNTRL